MHSIELLMACGLVLFREAYKYCDTKKAWVMGPVIFAIALWPMMLLARTILHDQMPERGLVLTGFGVALVVMIVGILIFRRNCASVEKVMESRLPTAVLYVSACIVLVDAARRIIS